jgi:hypothetical protein
MKITFSINMKINTKKMIDEVHSHHHKILIFKLAIRNYGNNNFSLNKILNSLIPWPVNCQGNRKL